MYLLILDRNTIKNYHKIRQVKNILKLFQEGRSEVNPEPTPLPLKVRENAYSIKLAYKILINWRKVYAKSLKLQSAVDKNAYEQNMFA